MGIDTKMAFGFMGTFLLLIFLEALGVLTSGRHRGLEALHEAVVLNTETDTKQNEILERLIKHIEVKKKKGERL